MEATVSLSWVAHMQEAGIPITYAYISDAHDGHGTSGNIHFAYGPGEAGYVKQLHDYDIAFGKFFDRLAADGINKSNTLFVFTVDEGDHFVGDPPTPAGCDGVNVACTYNRVGEINADLRRMIKTQFNDNTLFTVHSDDAPTVYINGNPARTADVARNLERESARLRWLNPYTGKVEKGITVALADPVQEKTLHMVTADPARTPTFTLFADPDWFFFATGGTTPLPCATPSACAFIPSRTNQSFAWNHGDIQDEIASTWVGYVGPGISNIGQVGSIWTDHTDLRPTILTLTGLRDDYRTDGRAVTEVFSTSALPASISASPTYLRLAAAYKQVTAPFGTFGMETLKASTKALRSNDSDDETYNYLENGIVRLTARRDTLVAQIRAAVNSAEFGGVPIDSQQAESWISQANALIKAAHELASQ
jgi:hypothetical protein